MLICINALGQSNDSIGNSVIDLLNKESPKMKVEIWSDIMCPFCYIGKRKFESALYQFKNKNEVEVVWHSFQLNPNLTYQPGRDSYDYIAELKGITRKNSIKVHQELVEMGKAVELDFRFDITKITNSFDAHRIIQLAKKHKADHLIEELFFKAYFTQGALMSDHPTLIKLATEAGLEKTEVELVLAGNRFAEEVRIDSLEARQLGVNGVPFFLIDRKLVVSGAQDSKMFLKALEKAYAAWIKENPEIND